MLETLDKLPNFHLLKKKREKKKKKNVTYLTGLL